MTLFIHLLIESAELFEPKSTQGFWHVYFQGFLDQSHKLEFMLDSPEKEEVLAFKIVCRDHSNLRDDSWVTVLRKKCWLSKLYAGTTPI